MKFVARNSRREIIITLSIWAVLLVAAIVALIMLKRNTTRIIEHIHYVNVNRVQKSVVLYAEAEKHAKAVFDKAQDLNLESEQKVVVSESNEHLRKAIALFEEAQELDQRPEFSPERRVYYEMQGQLHEAAGNRLAQLLHHARAFMTQENYEEALVNIRNAQDVATTPVESYMLLAQLYDLQGKTSEALTLLNDVESSVTLTPKTYWVRGTLNQKMGALPKAINDFRIAVESSPRNLTYRRDLSIAMKGSGKAEEASQIMQAGLDDGGWLDAAYLHVYGEYLIEAGSLDEAIRVLKQADELAPYSGDVQWSLAKAYHRAGKAREASAMLRRATEIQPELQDRVF